MLWPDCLIPSYWLILLLQTSFQCSTTSAWFSRGRSTQFFLIIEITSHYFSSKYLQKLAAVWESACKSFFCICPILLWGAEKDLSNKLLMSVLTKRTKVISCLNSVMCRSFHWWNLCDFMKKQLLLYIPLHMIKITVPCHDGRQPKMTKLPFLKYIFRFGMLKSRHVANA